MADAWRPEQYEKFAAERAQPFWDLLELVERRADPPGGRSRVRDGRAHGGGGRSAGRRGHDRHRLLAVDAGAGQRDGLARTPVRGRRHRLVVVGRRPRPGAGQRQPAVGARPRRRAHPVVGGAGAGWPARRADAGQRRPPVPPRRRRGRGDRAVPVGARWDAACRPGGAPTSSPPSSTRSCSTTSAPTASTCGCRCTRTCSPRRPTSSSG